MFATKRVRLAAATVAVALLGGGAAVAATTASALTWMVERACHQNLPTAPPSYDAELAASMAEIIWGTLYLKPISAS